MGEYLALSPFPSLEWDDYCWASEIVVPAWAGFYSHSAESPATGSDGSVMLNIVTPDDEQVLPSPEQAVAYQYLVDQQEVIRDSILEGIFNQYPKWQEWYNYDDEDSRKWMPNIERSDQLRMLIGLLTIRIFSVSKDGLAYVGFQYSCTWDSEHGLGVMAHANRIVKVGGADTAILEWIAKQDSESSQ